MIQNNLIEITIVGIRHYLPSGELGIPDFQKRHPVGSRVYLQQRSENDQYFGAIDAFDSTGNIIGTISSNDGFIARAFFEGSDSVDEEAAVIVKHLPRAVRIAVRDIGQLDKKAYLYYEKPEEGENVLPFTESEKTASRLSAHILQQLKSSEATETFINDLTECAEKYSHVSCCSLSGNNLYERRKVCNELQKFIDAQKAAYPNQVRRHLEEITNTIYEDANDMGKQDFQFKTYESMLEELRSLQGPTMEEYLKALAFTAGEKELSEETKQREIRHLTDLLKKSLEGNYAYLYDNKPKLANTLYYLKYSRETLYLFMTRVLKLEFLQGKTAKQVNHNKMLSNDELLKQAINKILVEKDKNGKILFTKQSQWYCVFHGYREKLDPKINVIGFISKIDNLFPNGITPKCDYHSIIKYNVGVMQKPFEEWKDSELLGGSTLQHFRTITKRFEEIIDELIESIKF